MNEAQQMIFRAENKIKELWREKTDLKELNARLKSENAGLKKSFQEKYSPYSRQFEKKKERELEIEKKIKSVEDLDQQAKEIVIFRVDLANGTKNRFLPQYTNCMNLNYEKRLVEETSRKVLDLACQEIEDFKQKSSFYPLSSELSQIKCSLKSTSSEIENTYKAIENLKESCQRAKKEVETKLISII